MKKLLNIGDKIKWIDNSTVEVKKVEWFDPLLDYCYSFDKFECLWVQQQLIEIGVIDKPKVSAEISNPKNLKPAYLDKAMVLKTLDNLIDVFKSEKDTLLENEPKRKRRIIIERCYDNSLEILNATFDKLEMDGGDISVLKQNDRFCEENHEYINLLGLVVNQTAKVKGFYKKIPSIAMRCALIHSEISELLQADRKERKGVKKIFATPSEFPKQDSSFIKWFEQYHKDTIPAECVDIIFRVLDLATHEGYNLGSFIPAVLRYNSLRDYKGKSY